MQINRKYNVVKVQFSKYKSLLRKNFKVEVYKFYILECAVGTNS